MVWALIVATYGRSEELRRLLESLCNQTELSFRVILVDQNQDDRLAPIVRDFDQQFRIDHLRIPPHGLSQARNVGLAALQDESLIAFPDDDCCYEKETLSQAAKALASSPDVEAIIGAWYPIGDAPPTTSSPTVYRLIDRFRIFASSPSYTLFFKRSAINAAGSFDETLGLGTSTPWISSEDSDYLLRAGGLRDAVAFTSDVRVFHPRVDGSTAGFEAKAFGYGRGRMRILRKHHYPLWFQILNILHPLVMAMLSPPAVRRFRWHLFRGRLHEWLRPYQHPGIK